MRDWPFEGLAPNAYGLILADPPWNFRNYSMKGIKKGAQAKYACMESGDIKSLPVIDLAHGDCALVMWATAPLLPVAIEVMGAWGFEYKTAGAWAKQSKTGDKWAFGTGYVLRSAAEFFLIGTVGKPSIGSRSIRNLLVAPVREHSRKPDSMHEQLESLFPCDRRCELFARQSRPGWDVWGNQAELFDDKATVM